MTASSTGRSESADPGRSSCIATPCRHGCRASSSSVRHYAIRRSNVTSIPGISVVKFSQANEAARKSRLKCQSRDGISFRSSSQSTSRSHDWINHTSNRYSRVDFPIPVNVLAKMPSVPTRYPDTPPPSYNRHLNALTSTSSDESLERKDSMSNGLSSLSNASLSSATSLAKRPPLPPHCNHQKRPTSRGHIGSTNRMLRSPSPCSVSSSVSYRAKSLSTGMRSPSVVSSRSRSSLVESATFSTPPRRTYPRESTCSPSMEDVLVKEQAPVVFDASLNFVLGCERQRVKQSFKPTASHLDSTTASSYLSSKISQFLKRTDHIMDEWRSLGHRDDINDDPISLPHARDKPRVVIGRSQSATNIMIRGYQYYSRSNSVANSPSRRSLSRASEDRTSDGMQEVTCRNDGLIFSSKIGNFLTKIISTKSTFILFQP